MKEDFRIDPIIAVPVIATILIFSVWALCFPVSEYFAEKRFASYMEEYNIPASDIESYCVKKGYTFAPVEIEVVYKSDSDFLYRYQYPICSFFNNRPEHVSIYTTVIHPEGCWHSYETLYDQLKYPPVTRK
ncbi:MAG: DUF3139 domain-containing protein [Oscillospiraceae bacterium]|nr:DUF3139 domain-containing protein [Oscillospiraceae bacterium]